MVSKYEVMDYLRVHGRSSMKEMNEFFKKAGIPGGVDVIVKLLAKGGYVKRYWRVVVKPNSINDPDGVIWIETPVSVKGRRVWVELTPHAYKLLKKDGVKRFIDLELAKLFNKLKMKRPFLKID